MRLLRLRLHKPPRDRIQTRVYRPTFLAFSLRRHDDVRYLQRWRLTRQRKHLIHSDPGPDCCITQSGLANLFLHATGAQLSDVGEDRDDSLFSCAYLRGFPTIAEDTKLCLSTMVVPQFFCVLPLPEKG
jgi:hypothetical protein